MRFSIPMLVVLALVCLCKGRAAEAPRTLALRSAGLVATRAELARGDPRLAVPLSLIRAEADQLLELRPASVMDKSRLAASADRHDYFSFAPYWWPDPKKANGLPYIRDDGKVNPDSKKGTDSAALARTCHAIETLSLAYYLTREPRYAQKAATLTRVWFLDPATRMNPNLQHAQAIPGINDGRGIGIIESRHFIELLDGLALLTDSPAWTKPDAEAMNAWLTLYYGWLTTSKHGRDEAAAQNNHGSWYDAQTVALALALGRREDAKALLATVPANRIAVQIEPDGRQPRELARTKALDYSLFNLTALVTLARLGEHVGVELWKFSTADGRSLTAALRYLAPYADPARAWPKADIKAADRARLLPLLQEAPRHAANAEFRALLEKFDRAPQPGEHWRFAASSPH
jgi:Alginate lyase